MVIEWREREHDDVDRVMHGDLPTQKALKRCEIYKFWNIESMRDQPRLLQILILLGSKYISIQAIWDALKI